MTLKNTAILCMVVLCGTASCKKSNSGSSSNYHVTATIDGTAQTFNTTPMALVITNGGVSMTTIEGFSASSSSTQTMALSWFANMPGVKFGTGTFSDTAAGYSTMGVYSSSATTSYVCGSGLVAMALGTSATITNHFKLVITSVDSTHVKGTFSGDFYFQDNISGAKKTVTAGDFDVPWKK